MKKKRENEEKERKEREKLEKKKEKEELAKKKAEVKLKRASQPPRQSKRSGKKLAASRSSNQVESTLLALSASGPSHNSTTATLEVGTSLSVVTTHDTVMHTTELNSASSTATVAPAGLNDQDYECCECFVTYYIR